MKLKECDMRTKQEKNLDGKKRKEMQWLQWTTRQALIEGDTLTHTHSHSLTFTHTHVLTDPYYLTYTLSHTHTHPHSHTLCRALTLARSLINANRFWMEQYILSFNWLQYTFLFLFSFEQSFFLSFNLLILKTWKSVWLESWGKNCPRRFRPSGQIVSYESPL